MKIEMVSLICLTRACVYKSTLSWQIDIVFSITQHAVLLFDTEITVSLSKGIVMEYKHTTLWCILLNVSLHEKCGWRRYSV